MRNGYRALPDDASDLDAGGNPNDECPSNRKVRTVKRPEGRAPTAILVGTLNTYRADKSVETIRAPQLELNRSGLEHSDFVIPSTFDIRISSFFRYS